MKREDFITNPEVPEEPEDSLELVKPNRRAKETIALVKLDGTAITTAGNVVKHNWFKDLALDSAKYSDILLTTEEAQALHAAHNRMKIGAASAIPMICRGKEVCPLSQVCPFVQAQDQIDKSGEVRNVIPIARQCPVELNLLVEWIGRYADEFGVDDTPGNYTDQRVILELAETEVLENRMNVVIATKYQDLTEDKVVAVMTDKYGEREQRVKGEADAFVIKQKLHARREKLRKNLVATRHDIYKREAALKEGTGTDNSNLQAETMNRLKRLEDIIKD